MLAMCLEKWPVTQGKRKMEANLADLTEDAGLNLKGAMLVMEPFAKMVTRYGLWHLFTNCCCKNII